MEYIRHFGNQSEDYLQYRPNYPEELYAYLAGLVKSPQLVWDAGTGNGQAAIKLAEYFKEVIGTDINQAQLDVAPKKENIRYYACPVEHTNIPDHTVDLVTVAQALHWFNFDKFYQEVRRVGKPNSLIAAWCYSLGKINPDINKHIEKLYFEILGDQYWPKERKYIEEMYTTIPFPFKKILTPYFAIDKKVTFPQLIGYLNTWSALKEYQKHQKMNPIDLIFIDLQKDWGDPTAEHIMHWPLHLLVGEIT